MFDPIVVQLLPMLTVKQLNGLTVITVLKLFRGVATSDDLALSQKLKDNCMEVLSQYICEHADDEAIQANMWLTVLDIAFRTDDKQLEAIAGKRF